MQYYYLLSKGTAASTVMPLNDDGLPAAGECGPTTNGRQRMNGQHQQQRPATRVAAEEEEDEQEGIGKLTVEVWPTCPLLLGM